MFCDKCGHQNRQESSFCNRCGNSMPDSPEIESQITSQITAANPSSFYKWLSAVAALIAVFAVGISLYATWPTKPPVASTVALNLQPSLSPTPQPTAIPSPTPKPTAAPKPTPERESVPRPDPEAIEPDRVPIPAAALVSDRPTVDPRTATNRVIPVARLPLVVDPQRYSWIVFDVPAGALNATLRGGFSARGGSGNDIQIIVTDEIGFTNFQNRHAYRYFYDSGKTTSDRVQVPLTPGKYYLIFNNQFSLMSNKTIMGGFALTLMDPNGPRR